MLSRNSRTSVRPPQIFFPDGQELNSMENLLFALKFKKSRFCTIRIFLVLVYFDRENEAYIKIIKKNASLHKRNI